MQLRTNNRKSLQTCYHLIIVMKGTVIHAISQCLECDWDSEDFTIARKEGERHNRLTGHAVTWETATAGNYPHKDKEVKTKKKTST